MGAGVERELRSKRHFFVGRMRGRFDDQVGRGFGLGRIGLAEGAAVLVPERTGGVAQGRFLRARGIRFAAAVEARGLFRRVPRERALAEFGERDAVVFAEMHLHVAGVGDDFARLRNDFVAAGAAARITRGAAHRARGLAAGLGFVGLGQELADAD